MPRIEKELQQLNGIGKGLARRLADAGFDSIVKVAAADESGLLAIKGMTRRPVAEIIEQAQQLTAASIAQKEALIATLQQELSAVRSQVQTLAASAGERFPEALETPSGHKLSKSIAKINASLVEVEGRIAKRPRRTVRVLTKAGKRLAGAADADLSGLRLGFKKARNELKRLLV
jgi:NAD(P)-dependent dehydrogenase (short-subunit alcohol dehydrogenase family)